MKGNELFKNIFALAVKLTGLWFIYLGFRDMPPILQLPTMVGYTTNDIVTAVLPAAFNLLVGWWLVANKFLIRCGYPDNMKSAVFHHLVDSTENAAAKPITASAAREEKSMDEKLATLVKNQK